MADRYTNLTPPDASELNATEFQAFNGLRTAGQNTIQQLQDREITFSADGGMFAEAYIDADGRKNSVVTADTTTQFVTDKYTAIDLSIDTDLVAAGTIQSSVTSGTNEWTTPENAFDGDDSTSASTSKPSNSNTLSAIVGKTFTSTFIEIVKVKASLSCTSNSNNRSIVLQTYNGTTWTNALTLASTTLNITLNVEQSYYLSLTVQGVRIVFSASSPGNNFSSNLSLSTLEGGDSLNLPTIKHAIPTGTFSSTPSTAFMTFKAEDWESGADVQFKLTNATEDTGWLASNEVVSFTALTAKPDECIVKLIPKATSPTAGYPSINGIALYSDRPA